MSTYNTAFTSDNIAGVSPQVLEAMARCNVGQADPYGRDACTMQAEKMLSDVFEKDARVFFVTTGTAANCLSLSALTPPWGAVLCHHEGHINHDECGAPEFFNSGARVLTLDGANSKIDPEALKWGVKHRVGDIHSSQPAAVSLTQATESGSVYSLDELCMLGAITKNHGLRMHMDGARFANALVTLNCSPAEMTWKCGVDIVSFGATKNGTMSSEAIVVFDKKIAQEMSFRIKRSGQLGSKMRFMAAQMLGYLENDLWLNNARQSNAMAELLKRGLETIPQISVLGSPQTNIIFCKMPKDCADRLLAQGFSFYHGKWEKDVIRLVTSFATTEQDIQYFLSAVNQAVGYAEAV